jgi:PhnB protein
MSFMPYLHFGGSCAEAMTFYAGLFGAGDLQMLRYGETNDGSGQATSDRIMHSQFSHGGQTLMASDMPPGMEGVHAQGFSVMKATDSVAEARRVFAALAEGGGVIIALEKTFWSPAFGMVRDRFGTPWIIASGPDPST